MSQAMVIAKRELSSYFYSPVAYVVMALFLGVAGWCYWDDFQPGQPAAMRSLFEWMVYLLCFAIPVLSMGLMSQEWDKGTIETLMTAPVSEVHVIVGKYLGSFGFFMVLLFPTLIYVVLLRVYSTSLDYGPIFAGYLGILLVGSLFISIGLFCSSLTRNAVISVVSSAAILFALTIIPKWINDKAGTTGIWRTFNDQLVFRRYTDFARGVLDLSHIVFFVSVSAVFLFLTIKVLESRRWR